MLYSVTVARFLTSDFDPELNMFRRTFIGADGWGYDFVRSIDVDRQNRVIESAVANEIVVWFRDNQGLRRTVVPFTPRPYTAEEIRWRPQIRVARATRSYWRPERQHIYTRVKTENDDTINIYIPAGLIPQLLHAFETSEVEIRSDIDGAGSEPD